MSKPIFTDFINDTVKYVLLEKTRAKMDAGIHVMHFSQESIRLGFSEVGPDMPKPTESDISQIYKVAFDVIQKKTKIYDEVSFDPKSFTGIYRLQEGDGLLLIAKSFSALRDFLSNNISRDPKLINTFLGVVEKSIKSKSGNTITNKVSTFDIGHMASFGLEEKNSPLAMKTYGIAERFRQEAEKSSYGTPEKEILFKASKDIDKFLERLKKAHIEYKCTFDKDLDLAASLVGKFRFIMTTPQSTYINQKVLASVESDIYEYVEAYLRDIKGSPSIIDMILYKLVNSFLGVKTKSQKYTNKQQGAVDLINNKVEGHGTPIIKAPQLRSIDGKFFSVLRLQNLINAQLHDRLRANMGTGYSTDVLNYRTGRFAKSAKVTAINKVGSNLNTYFDYMKYPYATFAPGGKQYKGDTRDPEKLISRSIREIAVQQVQKQFLIRPIVVT